jgi:hypothetical protein
VRASISVSEAGVASGGYSVQRYERQMASIPLYRLFWNRVDYMLGRRADWVTCGEAAAELEKTNTNTAEALGGLCGPTSDGRDAPPPQPFPAIAVQPVSPPGQMQRVKPPTRQAPKVATTAPVIQSAPVASVAPQEPQMSERDRDLIRLQP